MRSLKQSIKEGIISDLISSLILGFLALLGRPLLYNLSWESDNLASLIIVELGITLLSVSAVLLMLRWLISKILLPVLKIKIPKVDRTANPYKRRTLLSKQWTKQKATLDNLIKANRFQTALCVIAIPLLLVLNVMMCLGFINYLNLRKSVFLYNNTISTLASPDIQGREKVYWVVYQNISALGDFSQKIDFTKRLFFALEREANRYNLPIRIIPKNLTDISIDSLAAVSKGVLIVSGFLDDFGAKIKIENRSRKTKSQLFLNTLGIFELGFYDLFKQVSKEQNFYDTLIERQFDTEFSQEYQLQLGIMKDLNYFTFKMISEFMINEIMGLERRRNESGFGLELMKLIDFSISALEVSKSHLPYEINFWSASPKLKSNLNSDGIFSNLSSLFALRASSIKKFTPHQVVEEAAILRAKEDIEKASQYLNVLMTEYPENYFYNLLEIYHLSIKLKLDMLQNKIYWTEAERTIKKIAESSDIKKLNSAIDTHMILSSESTKLKKILDSLERKTAINNDAYKTVIELYKKIELTMELQSGRIAEMRKKLKLFLESSKKEKTQLTLALAALLTIFYELGESLNTTDELSSSIKQRQTLLQESILQLTKALQARMLELLPLKSSQKAGN